MMIGKAGAWAIKQALGTKRGERVLRMLEQIPEDKIEEITEQLAVLLGKRA